MGLENSGLYVDWCAVHGPLGKCCQKFVQFRIVLFFWSHPPQHTPRTSTTLGSPHQATLESLKMPIFERFDWSHSASTVMTHTLCYFVETRTVSRMRTSLACLAGWRGRHRHDTSTGKVELRGGGGVCECSRGQLWGSVAGELRGGVRHLSGQLCLVLFLFYPVPYLWRHANIVKNTNTQLFQHFTDSTTVLLPKWRHSRIANCHTNWENILILQSLLLPPHPPHPPPPIPESLNNNTIKIYDPSHIILRYASDVNSMLLARPITNDMRLRSAFLVPRVSFFGESLGTKMLMLLLAVIFFFRFQTSSSLIISLWYYDTSSTVHQFTS